MENTAKFGIVNGKETHKSQSVATLIGHRTLTYPKCSPLKLKVKFAADNLYIKLICCEECS